MTKINLVTLRFFSAASLLLASFIHSGPALSAAEPNAARERVSLDFGWKFHLGNPWGDVIGLAKADDNRGPAKPDFSDFDWRTVDLPHDWAVELPFDRNADYNHGFKPVGPGFPQNNLAWYRRSFSLPKTDAGKRLWLEFDGVYRDCDVFVNGWFIGNHDGGYNGFRYDITALAHPGGTNVIAVKVDASKFEGWFYEGAGIYRHVRLVKTSPVALAPDGVFVYSRFKNNVPEGAATIKVKATVLNTTTNEATARVTCEVISPDGQSVAEFKAPVKLAAISRKEVELAGKVSAPELWSPESPKLYKLITAVERNGEAPDRSVTEFGIRTVAFDSAEGFLLNGKHYEVKGTCNHQDAAGVWAAVPDALQYFRIAKLKEMGCNAYRTSHNAPTPELLDACDRLGMLVLDENRFLGSDAANLRRLGSQIVRDRNHPSVFCWSLGNEEWNAQGTAEGGAVIGAMQTFVYSLDPTRLCTTAVNGSYGEVGIFASSEVRGLNYNFEGMDAYHTAHPGALILGTEQASTIGTRGIYTNDASLGYVSAYDDHNPSWGQTAEEWWTFFDARPWLSGGFVWTGFDYRGEPTPYQWPCVNSHFGIVDTCGFPKDNFWYYQAWWKTNTVLHLLPHWTWPGREGQEISVRALSNCQEVELFLNGQSLGRQTMKKDSELKWKVKYVPGTLSAKGYNDGKLVTETKAETTGAPAAIQLTPDRSTITADGKDLSIFSVAMVDAQGRVVPEATNSIDFTLSGSGKILGVGNGDPSCHEPDKYFSKSNIQVIPVNDGWHYKIFPDVKDSGMPELQPGFNDGDWDKVDPQMEADSLNAPAQAVFRTVVTLNAEDLASESIQLKIGRIDDRGWVYVNGKQAGESHDWASSPAFDVKPLLQAGQNTITVAVINTDGVGGIGREVNLRFLKKVEPPEWRRSAFNGLAQILVQSDQQPGEIKLTAVADGLSPATAVIQSVSEDQAPN